MINFATILKTRIIMKKILFSLIALMAVMTVQAQSICATWRCMQPSVQTEEDGSLIIQNPLYTFNEDGTYYSVNEMTMSAPPAQTMELEIAINMEIKGTYKLEGNKLTLTPNADTYKAEVLSVSQNGKVTDDAAIKSGITQMLNGKEAKAEAAAVNEFTVTVNDTMLEMNDGDETMSFMRISTIKN